MKKLYIISVLAILGLSANAQYSNATLNGPWLLYAPPIHTTIPDSTPMYFVFDGNGHITDMSGFGTLKPSTYNVTASGAISMTIISESISGSVIDTFQESGQLTSQNSGTGAGGYKLARIPNPGALTDTLTGVVNFLCSSKNVKLKLNSSGVIVSVTGDLTAPVTGRVYADSGIFIGHIKTGDGLITHCGADQGSWDEFTITGKYLNDSLTGLLCIDGPHNTPFGTAKLKRTGSITGIVPLAATASDIIIFPNPVKRELTIEIPKAAAGSQQEAAGNIEIYNLIGERVYSSLVTDNHSLITVNIAYFPSGVYFLQVKTESRVEVRKFVKE